MEVTDTFSFLLGSWRLQRSYRDHHGGLSGTFAGTAAVALVPGTGPGWAGYHEQGRLSMGAHRGPAERRLLVHDRQGAALVCFSDGRPYVDLDLRTGHWQAVHLCGPDRYQITTLVTAPGTLVELWRVTGPAKDYQARTQLTRIPEGP